LFKYLIDEREWIGCEFCKPQFYYSSEISLFIE
jgi:hypothetical protein